MAQGHVTDYKLFYDTYNIPTKPISLQTFSDDDATLLNQAKRLASYGPNVYVKVPIIKSSGEYNHEVIRQILDLKIPLNITAVYTIDQIVSLYEILRDIKSPVILSVFAGRISDTGRDPKNIVRFACQLYSQVEVLWAGCKEVLSIHHAIDCGCKIITIPDTIIDRMSRIDKDLTELSKETVSSFNKEKFDI